MEIRSLEHAGHYEPCATKALVARPLFPSSALLPLGGFGQRRRIGNCFYGDLVKNDPIVGRRQRSESQLGDETDGGGGGGVESQGSFAGGVIEVRQDEIAGVGAREPARLPIRQIV